MNIGGFLFFNTVCDFFNGIAKTSKCPPKGTPSYRRAAIGSIIAIILWIITIFVLILSL